MRPISQIKKELEQDFGSAWSYYPDKAMEAALSLAILLDAEKAEVKLWKERHGKQLEHSAELTCRVDSLTSENVKLLAERRRLTDEASRNGGMLFRLIESMSGHDQMKYVDSYLISWYQRQKQDRETPEERRVSEAEAAKLQQLEEWSKRKIDCEVVPGDGLRMTANARKQYQEFCRLRDSVRHSLATGVPVPEVDQQAAKKTDTVLQSECVRAGAESAWEELPAIEAEPVKPDSFAAFPDIPMSSDMTQGEAKSPVIEKIVVTGKAMLDLDFFIDRQKRFGYTAKGTKDYDFDNALWMQAMERLEGCHVDLEVSKFVPKYIEFDVIATTEASLFAAIKAHERTGWQSFGGHCFDKDKKLFKAKMRKIPQAR